jgi:hypothetical protein
LNCELKIFIEIAYTFFKKGNLNALYVLYGSKKAKKLTIQGILAYRQAGKAYKGKNPESLYVLNVPPVAGYG